MKVISKNRSCLVCGEKYEFCPAGCHKSINKPSWMGMFHSENCRDIYYACANYMIGKTISKEEAKTELEKLDLSAAGNSSFNPKIKEWINEITNTVTSNEKKKTKKTKEVGSVTVSDLEFENNFDEEPVG